MEARGTPPVALGTAEIRQYRGVVPTREPEVRPVVVVGRTTAHVHEAVDRVRASEHLATRRRYPPAIGVRLRFGFESPRQARIAKCIAPGQRHRDTEELALVIAGFE